MARRMAKRGGILLVTPPLVQANTWYPATPVLTGYLRRRGWSVAQEDLSLAFLLDLFTPARLRALGRAARRRLARQGDAGVDWPGFGAAADRLAGLIEPLVAFLQDRAPEWAPRLLAPDGLPDSPRVRAARRQDCPAMVGAFELTDRARYMASQCLDDIADAIRQQVDARFGFARYAEHLAVAAPAYQPLRQALDAPAGLLDRRLEALADAAVRRHRPAVLGLTVPFPGCLYGALRIARAARRARPGLRIVLGGGYVSTELRDLKAAALFDDVDAVCLDDGLTGLSALLEYWAGRRPATGLYRTWRRVAGRLVYAAGAGIAPVPHTDSGPPAIDGLPLGRYLSLFEMANPVHRLWSGGQWNKLMLAHGCSWRRCRFCDVRLDYIARHERVDADTLVDWIEDLIRQTGRRGFHFTDEAAPPEVLEALAQRLLARRVTITWWTNIRFERAFTPALARRLAAAGCIAVTGGLETACDRTLRLMDKGVTVAGARRVLRAFARAGILTHAYLMYGFPGQRRDETLAALDTVRGLFAEGALQSAYWHRFALTVHSHMARRPERYGIGAVRAPDGDFACNEALYTVPGGDRTDLVRWGRVLRRATYNFMHGCLLDRAAAWWWRQTP